MTTSIWQYAGCFSYSWSVAGGYMATTKRYRPDKDGTHRATFDKNKKRIYATQSVCALCGRPVDFSLKFPDPMSPTIDHIIPIAKGGHPSDIENLQLAHLACNRKKADKGVKVVFKTDETINSRVLPQSMDWKTYRP